MFWTGHESSQRGTLDGVQASHLSGNSGEELGRMTCSPFLSNPFSCLLSHHVLSTTSKSGRTKRSHHHSHRTVHRQQRYQRRMPETGYGRSRRRRVRLRIDRNEATRRYAATADSGRDIPNLDCHQSHTDTQATTMRHIGDLYCSIHPFCIGFLLVYMEGQQSTTLL